MSTVTIRPVRSNDLAELRGVYRRSSLSNEGDRGALLANPDALVWSGDRIGTNLSVAAVDDRGVIVGFATIETNQDGTGELEDLFVDPPMMRRGIARQLIAELERAARESGIATVLVVANPHALNFYAAVGFVDSGAAATEFGEGRRMVLRLGDSTSTGLR